MSKVFWILEGLCVCNGNVKEWQSNCWMSLCFVNLWACLCVCKSDWFYGFRCYGNTRKEKFFFDILNFWARFAGEENEEHDWPGRTHGLDSSCSSQKKRNKIKLILLFFFFFLNKKVRNFLYINYCEIKGWDMWHGWWVPQWIFNNILIPPLAISDISVCWLMERTEITHINWFRN